MKMKLVFFLLTLSLLTIGTQAQTPAIFKCKTPAMCQALVDYIPPNTTTLFDIKTLFGLKNHRNLLGANQMLLTTPPTQSIPAKKVIKIPFPCICTNGTGISNKRPVYKVKKDDGLDHIARDIFNLLMTYQQIAAVNNISDPNKIEVGQELWIPLPCSCDVVDGEKKVHYGHVVPTGSTVQGIADEFGTTEQTLLSLNGLADPTKLLAGAVLDVPLKACTSVIRNTSLDSSLLVPNGTYAFTANNCIQCTCDASNNWTLQCKPSTNVKVANWSQCPLMQCEGSGNLSIGAAPSSSCPRKTCAYAGYTKDAILTMLVDDPTCSTDGGTKPSSDSYGIRDGLQRRSWSWLLMSLLLGLLGFDLLH